ncbi:MAG: hypothetical protein L3J88_08620 [Gammaproteobacteria bacterium]|nr:hypothetical protein [Gammaproteobacteria bacterium]MCF6363391.1 hypothetical protein [Gammaproteobacteria bacterium]
MMQNRIGLIVFILSFLLFGLNVRAADIPMMMNYQGSVTDAAGVPINGDGFFKFAVVNEAGDMAYWANDGTTMDGTEPTAAVTIPVSDGRFVVKIGDTDLANMTALSPSVFDNTRIYLRVWFSIDELNFEKFATDMQVVSTGFAVKAQSVGYDGLKSNADIYMTYKPNDTACTDNQIMTWDAANTRWICGDINIAAETDPTVDPSVKDGVSWGELSGRPAGLDDGDDVGITTESDPTVLASVKDGISWGELSDRPAGLDDGDDVGVTTESDPTVLASVKDGVSWGELSDRPAGLDDGDDIGITTESDPTVLASVKDGVSWGELSDRPAGLDDGDDVDITAIKQGVNTSSVVITATSGASAQNMTSLTVTPPADGYVFVVASGRFGINQTVVVNNYAYASVSTISGQHSSSNDTAMVIDSSAGTVALRSWVPLYINRIELVTASTPITFYAVAYRDSSGNNSIYMDSLRLTAIFIPNLMP